MKKYDFLFIAEDNASDFNLAIQEAGAKGYTPHEGKSHSVAHTDYVGSGVMISQVWSREVDEEWDQDEPHKKALQDHIETQCTVMMDYNGDIDLNFGCRKENAFSKEGDIQKVGVLSLVNLLTLGVSWVSKIDSLEDHGLSEGGVVRHSIKRLEEFLIDLKNSTVYEKGDQNQNPSGEGERLEEDG